MLKRIIALSMLTLLLGMGASAQNASPTVIASHSILADVARQIAGARLDVRTLIPAGSDPHHFIPTPSDLAAVAEADLVLINGIGYEETLLEAIENAGANVNIVVASACIDVRPAGAHEDEDDHAHEDEGDHADEGDDGHAHEDEDDHADEDDDDHADEGDDDHAHEDEDDHADEDDYDHADEGDDDHADEGDDDHAHEDEDDHAHEDELSDCDAQDAEVSAMGIHVHGEFLGRAGEIECAAHDHGDEHEDEHGDEHDDDHAEEHDDEHDDDHGEMHDDHGHEEGACDPHIWFDPHNVIRWALTIRDSFSEIDPDHASEYHENALAYAAKLVSLEADFIEPALENLPVEKRLLVTAHDALGYLAGAFNFQIVSTVIPGVSTVVEPSASDVAAVIDVIREHDVQAIFGESTTSDKILQVIAAETGVEIAPLYTDSLSPADGPAATYLEYMRYNFATIVEALSG